MRAFRFPRLAAALALAALATAGPVNAGTWNGPANTGIQHFPVGNSADQLLVHYGYETLTGDPTWVGAFAPQSSTHFDAKTFVANNCPVLGGAYRPALITENVDDISVRWQTYTEGNLVDFPRSELGTLRLASDPTQALTRTTIEAGRPAPNPLKNYHPNGWYWEPSLSGIGFGVNIQGDTLFVGIFSCTAAGKPTWHVTTGAMTSNAIYSGTLESYSKATGVPVSTNLGTINMTFFLANELFPDTHRIAVTLPGGATMTLQKYSR